MRNVLACYKVLCQYLERVGKDTQLFSGDSRYLGQEWNPGQSIANHSTNSEVLQPKV